MERGATYGNEAFGMNVDGSRSRSGEARNSSMERYGGLSRERRMYGMSCKGTNSITVLGSGPGIFGRWHWESHGEEYFVPRESGLSQLSSL